MKGGVQLYITLHEVWCATLHDMTIQCNEGWCAPLHHTRTPDRALSKIVGAGAPKIVRKNSAGPLWSAAGGWTPVQ